MAKATVEEVAKTNAEELAKGGEAAAKMMKSGAEAVTESGAASSAAIQELTKAYQELAIETPRI